MQRRENFRRSASRLSALADSRRYPVDSVIDQHIKPVEAHSNRPSAHRVDGSHYISATRNSWIPASTDPSKSHGDESIRPVRSSESIMSSIWQQSHDTLRHASQGVVAADLRRSTLLLQSLHEARKFKDIDDVRRAVQEHEQYVGDLRSSLRSKGASAVQRKATTTQTFSWIEYEGVSSASKIVKMKMNSRMKEID
ncbi:hypothetical protein GUITHDRAFT_114067 [Guillardia theta CCMP2712]|uniref:Uncharacterized protein n=1 Tax=Guillardia theta (strain CCMP2712) TaxID=905079 RepID=L1IUR2_GUITC|nr:hypothetical protein GUITHDRAFT_114067 [Guillardia theta CCMP2712]EKX39817.1 hypothetical protein GUITHDRAFT_114067 [Guillardia theta CCMP2712]|eukprot:XP_005826797.1 hypothetical protein GUITHDRAFT_114067 [Guillardia theta CCMP2712]